MAGGIFISYRRDDTRHVAGRLAGDLMDRFGAERIFRDIDSIDAGDEFPQRLDKALNHCVLMLVLIGRQWLDATDDQQRRRLDDPNDWVRLEIATALRRGIRVVPVRANPIDAFRGQGKGGATARLLASRRQDLAKE